MVTDNQRGITHDETAGPMETAGPIIAVISAIAILLLGGLMATDFIWTAQHPVTIAHAPVAHAMPASPATVPTTTAPARAPG